jgi:hypothetical protein
MNSTELPLRAVRTQVQFEIATAAAAVAQATAATTRARRRMMVSSRRHDALAGELRTALGRSHLNPALLGTMRRLFHVEHVSLQQRQATLEDAQRREQQERAALAELRNRERSLDRALQAERRRRQLAQRAREMNIADDLWLQHCWRQAQ